MSWLPVLLLALPLASVPIAVFAKPRVAQAVTAAAGITAFGLAVAGAIHVRNGATITDFDHWLRLDSLGAVFLLATAFIYATASLFSIGYLRADADRRDYRPFARRYFAYLNLFAWTMLLVPLVNDFAMLWIAVELTTIVSALLVALDRTDAALEAAWKYVLIASAGLGIALLAVILLYAAGTDALGNGYLPRFSSYLDAAGSLSAGPVKIAFLFAAIGFGTKAGFVPVHTWLPDAHSEAPTPVSALLSGALLCSAFYAILRFYQVASAVDGSAFPRHVLLVLGAASLVLAALYVLSQRNYKRLLAYSSIEHMGVIALGVGFGTPLAVAGALLHVLNHAAAKGLAFFGAGSILRRFDSKEIDDVHDAATALPWSGPMFLAAALALSGVPLSGVFRSEFQIVAGGFQKPAYVWVALLIVLVNLAFFGVIWQVGRMVLSKQSAGSAQQPRETSWWMVGAMLACLVVVIGIGLHVPDLLNQLLTEASKSLGAGS
jgi:hydrogenase-4 component F